MPLPCMQCLCHFLVHVNFLMVRNPFVKRAHWCVRLFLPHSCLGTDCSSLGSFAFLNH